MSARSHGFLTIFPIIALCLVTGCVSTDIGPVVYDAGGIAITFSHAGEPVDGYVQVTVYRILENRQGEISTLYAPLALQPGDNRVTVPAALDAGQYKLYIYLILNGERKAAAIRDITVT